MSISLTCPRCEYTIRSAAPGTTILCPSCRGRVTVPAAEKPAPAPAKAAEPPRSAPPKSAGDYDGDESQTKKTKRRSNVPLLIGIGLAVVAIVGGFAATALFAARDRARMREAEDVMRARQLAEHARGQQVFKLGGLGDGGDAAVVADLDQLAAQWPAIPHDEVRAHRLRTARAVWSRKTTVDAFDRANPVERPGAKAARDALEGRAAEMYGHPEFGAPLNIDPATVEALSAAVAAGSDDPLVQYYHSGAFFGTGRPDAAEARRIGRKMWESEYPPVRKAYVVHQLLLVLRAANAPVNEVTTWDERFWDAFGRAAAEPDPITQDHVIDLARLHEFLSTSRGTTRERAYDQTAAALQKAGAPEYTRKVVRGGFLIRHAWDARGGGFADTVTVDGARLFQERLTVAQAALTAAYELDADRPHAPTLMLTVCKGRGHLRPEMETWFERAMTADPDNFQACIAKLDYLHPKWRGKLGEHEHIGFAWQCARCENAYGLLPYAAVSAVASGAPLPPRFPPGVLEQIQPYYAEERVWQVLHTALTALRRERPKLKWLNGEYVRFALVAGRHDLAERVLDEVGNNPRDAGFPFADDLPYYREWAKTGRPPQ